MEKAKKSKKENLEKLRKILDNDSNKYLHPDDEKYLKVLSKRLKGSYEEKVTYHKTASRQLKTYDADSLKPKVTIHTRKPEKSVKPMEIIKEKTEEKEDPFKSEDIIEVEKVTISEPEFIEVKPKDIEKKEEFEPVVEKKEEKLIEWEMVETPIKKVEEKEIIKKPELEDEITEIKTTCKKCGSQINKDSKFCPECGEKIVTIDDLEEQSEEIKEELEIVPVDKGKSEIKDEEKIKKDSVSTVNDQIDIDKPSEEFIEIKPKDKEIAFCEKCGAKLKKDTNFCVECGAYKKDIEDKKIINKKRNIIEEKSIVWEPVEIEDVDKDKDKLDDTFIEKDILDEPTIDSNIKNEIFNEISSIDEKTAILLYDNGFTTIDALSIASVKDIAKIKGIKKKLAKKIKKEIEEITKVKKEQEENSFEEINEDNLDVFEEVEKKPELVESSWDEDVIASEKQEEIKVESSVKIEAFKNLDIIDEKTAILLYDNGFTTIDALSIASVKDIAKIKGIKKKLAKKIKKEIENPSDVKEFNKYIVEQVKPIDVKDTSEVEITEEQIIEKKEDEIAEQQEKINAFKELNSVTDDIAFLLYDNGYSSVDDLKEASVKDISKIRGIKKKVAKEIKKEIDKKIQESVKLKPIDIGDTAKGEITKEQLVDEEAFENQDAVPSTVELSSKKSEWSPISDEELELEKEKDNEEKEWEQIDIKEEKSLTLEDEKDEEVFEEIEDSSIFELEKDNDVKIDKFKEVKSIKEETAILLFDSGYKSIEDLKKANIKDLSKIKGIKKKAAKKIKKEIEEKFSDLSEKNAIIDESDEFIEEDNDTEEINIDEKISKHIPSKKEEENFEEAEDIEDIPLIPEETEDVFKNIKSIDEKISQLLKEKGINSLNILYKKSIKDLTKIKGIRKKVAQEIKKEVTAEKKRLDDEESNNKSFDREENPYIEEWEDEENWEELDEDKLPDIVKTEIKEYRHGDYTLYEKEIKTKTGKNQKIRFFSKGKPEDGEPISLPKGYEVKENSKTGVPYLKKKK